MALPEENTPFPPAQASGKELLRHWALYANRSYNSTTADDPTTEKNMASEGKKTEPDYKVVRSGIVSDVAGRSASLLLGENTTYKAPEDEIGPDQAREAEAYLNRQMSSGLKSRLLEAGELAASLKGAFIRLVANPDINPTAPYATVIDPLRADPTWVDGHLVACTTWSELYREGNTVIRFLENRDNRTRTIESGLYEGTLTTLGKKIPLKERPETEMLEETVTYPDELIESIFYLPNAYPDRNNPQNPMGRSDFQGLESLIVELDNVYTAMARDVRTAATRIIVPSNMLRRPPISDGPNGGGATFELEREVYTELNIQSGEGEGIRFMQGQIRTKEHIADIEDLSRRIIQGAGYSPHSFGIGDFGTAQSGTALKIREGSTFSTTNAKRTLWEPVLERIGYNLLALARSVYGINVPLVTPRISWSPIRSDDPMEQANVLNTLRAANAISIETSVKRAQPQLDETGIAEEVNRIQAEKAATEQTPNETGDTEDTTATPIDPAEQASAPIVPESGNKPA